MAKLTYVSHSSSYIDNVLWVCGCTYRILQHGDCFVLFKSWGSCPLNFGRYIAPQSWSKHTVNKKKLKFLVLADNWLCMWRYYLLSHLLNTLFNFTVFIYVAYTDINECNRSPCHQHAACVNIPGSFSCTCNEGWTGDGIHCNGKYSTSTSETAN